MAKKINVNYQTQRLLADMEESRRKSEVELAAKQIEKDELFKKHFLPIFDKGWELARIVWAYKSPKRDTSTSGPTETISDIEKVIDDMQARIEDLRLDIFNLGDLRREFECWLSYVIPRLRDLENELVECRQFLQENEFACLRRLSRLEFHLPI